MGDMTCGPSSHYSSEAYYSSESLTCEMPPEESLVCEDPPKPPPPPPKDTYPQSVPQSTQPPKAYGFLDSDEMMCKEPAPAPMPDALICVEGGRMHLDENQFTADLSNSKLVAELELEAKDINGAQNISKDDIEGLIKRGKISVNQELFAPAFYSMKGTSSSNPAQGTTTEIKDVQFDAESQAYVMKLKVKKDVDIPLVPSFLEPTVWDNFEVRFQVNHQGKLVAKIDDNWFPNNKILNQLEHKIRDGLRSKIPSDYQAIRFSMQKDDDTITLTPEVKNLEVPLAGHGQIKIEKMDGQKAQLEIDRDGHIHVHLKQVPFQGSTGSSGSPGQSKGPADTAQIQVKMGVGKDNSRQVYARGQLSVDLDETETPQIKMGYDALSHFMRSGTLHNEFSLYLQQQSGETPKLETRNYVDIENADLGSGQKAHLKTTLQLKFDPQTGLHLDAMDYDYPPLELNTSPNGVELMVNGEEYYPQMRRLISDAKESIGLETFMYMDDEMGQEIAHLLARKAAGLEAEGSAKRSQVSPEGVDVRFIFNSWKGNQADGDASSRMLQDAKAKVKQEIEASPHLSAAQKTRALAQLEHNLNWKFFTEGILRSDHRKVLVVDGSQATVGGMNIGKRYMGETGYHDVMLKVAGPEVRNIHKEFLENWFEFNGQPQPSASEWAHLLKSPAALEEHLDTLQAQGAYQGQAKVQMLVTDDQQVDIERGLIKLIDEAETEINIQQAFFADETINRHLAKAIDRGVKINVIVAETPLAESVFTSANLLSVYELAKRKQAGAKGDIRLFYYGAGQEGKRSQIHTKAITADGQRAIMGSANMIGRSLSSPFMQVDKQGQVKQAMFNKEMSLLIDDPAFVQEINSRLFEQDMVHNARELDAKAIEAEVKKAGGEVELRKKAVAAPFT